MVLEPEYVQDLDALDLNEVRRRRDTATDVEAIISYYRRMLHGRMDLLDFELKRRSGTEERTILEALPEILASGMVLGAEPVLKHIETLPPLPEVTGRRSIDKVMADGVLLNLSELTEDDIHHTMNELRDTESELSGQRRRLHSVIDDLQEEMVRRYKLQQDDSSD